MNFGWQNLEFEYMILILPINDLKFHHIPNENADLAKAETVYCSCKPRVETCGKLLVIHNSFDGREFFENEIVEGANIKWH